MQLSPTFFVCSASSAAATGTVMAVRRGKNYYCNLNYRHRLHRHHDQRRGLFTSRLKGMLRNIFSGDDYVNPKKLLERRYAYYALLAMRFRSLRLQQQQQKQQQQHQPASSAATTTFDDGDDKDDDVLYEQAIEELDAKHLDQMRNTQLRQELQRALQPQVIDILSTFQQVDDALGIDKIDRRQNTYDDDDDDDVSRHAVIDRPFYGWDWDPFLSILNDEYTRTCSDLRDHQHQHHHQQQKREQEEEEEEEGSNKSAATRRTIAFLDRKKGALETVLRFHDNPDEEICAYVNTTTTTTSDDNQHHHGDDVFGMNLHDTNKRSLELIRHYQTINLARSALIRDKLGYSVVCFQSAIAMAPNNNHAPAGRGLFVDGNAMAGSLMAFIPGEIWPKEHLLTKSVDVIEHFNDDDDDCQVTLRFDDYVVDSRCSPVTVLSREGSMNPWALGHMVNHPPPQTLPNCQSTMLNYTDQMELGRLVKYIPNTYARNPGWQSRLFDIEPTLMHGMGILARRDVCNEELVYDYRIQSDTTPDWYSVVDYSGSGDNNNDLMMDKEQVVFFRNDWMDKQQ